MIKAGIIGYGKMGKLHAKGYRNAGCEVVGAYDSHMPNDGTFAFETIEQLLQSVDIVSVCTPSFSHFEIAEKAIKSKKAVMIEKPLALTTVDCESIMTLEKQYNAIVSVGHIERFNSAFQTLQKNLHKIGNIKSVRAVRTNPASNRITDADVIADLTVHDLDLLRTVCGGYALQGIHIENVERSKRGGDIDKIIVSALLNSVAIGIHTSRIAEIAQRQLIVIGESGTLEADLLKRKLYLDGEEIEVAPTDQIDLEIHSFVTAYTQKTLPAVSTADGLFAVKSSEDIRAVINSDETSI